LGKVIVGIAFIIGGIAGPFIFHGMRDEPAGSIVVVVLGFGLVLWGILDPVLGFRPSRPKRVKPHDRVAGQGPENCPKCQQPLGRSTECANCGYETSQ
jgi:hypothetical protein